MINYVESVELIETVVTECSRERVLLVKLECILGWHTAGILDTIHSMESTGLLYAILA